MRRKVTRSDGAPSERTYSIWPFFAAFVLLGAVGLAGLLLIGSPSTPTETLPPFNTTTTVPTSSVPGDELPDGVTDVVSDAGVTTYVLDATTELLDDSPVAVVARAQAAPGVGDGSIVVDVACTTSDAEELAEVRITETSTSITVRPVVVAPQDGPPCTASTPGRQISLALQAPVAGRTLVLDAAGTTVEVPTG